MKRNWLKTALLISAFVVLSNITLSAQISGAKTAAGDVPALTADEIRPFDFKDEYYLSNGVIPEMLLNRSNGADGQSVFDSTNDPRYKNIRVVATRPAYGRNGETLYWNFYGEFYKDSYTDDAAGQTAYEAALAYQIYMFPRE